MKPSEYLASIKERLLSDPVVASFRVIKERVTLNDGHLRARLILANGSQLEFSEYFQVASSGETTVVTYSYQWANAHDALIRRWDNTPHFPSLPGFPHHIHDGVANTVDPGRPVSIFVVLDEIEQRLSAQ